MQQVERFRVRTRVLHWVHVAAFLVLLLTGLFLYVPGWGAVAVGGWTRLIHRLAAAVFILAPLIYLIFNPKTSWSFLKKAFIWGKEDLGWLKAAPNYYFGGAEEGMPPQEHINTGQKLYWLVVIVTGVLFVVTGLIMWFLKGIVPPGVFQWYVFIHDLAVILVFSMFLVHLFLSVLHPLFPESLWSMIGGVVSVKYAKSHHGKWYDRISKIEEKAAEGAGGRAGKGISGDAGNK